jgi:alpha-ketoglutarate-dependent taurine dioxygenase
MKVTPLGKRLGARVDGVDLAAPVSASTFDDIEAAFHAHGVIAVSDQVPKAEVSRLWPKSGLLGFIERIDAIRPRICRHSTPSKFAYMGNVG